MGTAKMLSRGLPSGIPCWLQSTVFRAPSVMAPGDDKRLGYTDATAWGSGRPAAVGQILLAGEEAQE